MRTPLNSDPILFELMLLKLTTSLLADVFGLLSVREAVIALTFVVRRPDVRVPWTRVAVTAEDSGLLLRYACLARLVNFEATLQTNSVTCVNSVLAAAPGLLRLSLFVVGDTSLLLSLNPTLGVRELALSLKHAQVATNEPLVRFLAAFPRLGQLALEFSMFYPSAILGWLVEALSSLKLGCLRTLALDGATYLQNQGIERRIAECQHHLKDLRIDLRGSKSPGASLDTLLGLETCRVTANEWSDAKFLERLPNLRVLGVCVVRDGDEVRDTLRIPPTVTEFSSGADFFPRVVWPAGLEALQLNVNAHSLARLLALLPNLQRLQSLSLTLTDGKREAPSLIEQPGFVCGSVRRLALLRFVTYAGLLGAFPGLCELELRLQAFRLVRERDLELSSLFGLCSELQTVKDTQMGSIVTIGRRKDGRLVRREADSTCML